MRSLHHVAILKAQLSSEAHEPPKEWTEQGDSSQVLQVECCSQCRDSSHGLLQCECCDLWYCSGCSKILEETMNVIGEVNSLHFFCLPCELEVFKLINKNSASIYHKSRTHHLQHDVSYFCYYSGHQGPSRCTAEHTCWCNFKSI